MCEIKEVTGYRLNDKIHPTRNDAVMEGLAEVVADIHAKHGRDMREGLIENKDRLLYLLYLHDRPEPKDERQYEGIRRVGVPRVLLDPNDKHTR